MIVWCVATLGFYSRKLSVEDIARVLRTEASRRVERGSPVIVRGEILRLREESVWSLDSPLDDSATVESHLEYLLGFIEGKTSEILSLAADCDIAVYVSFSTRDNQGGFTLPPSMLKRLGELDIRMEVSFMGNEEDVEDD
jgi:hypothetical protein